jgi:hypothetical protein
VQLLAAERRRQVVQLRIRGLSFEAIGMQLGFGRQLAHKHYKRALKLIPKAGVDEMRKLEAERIADLRQRIWSELAGRPDPSDPNRTLRPSPERLADLVRTALRISRHEAMVFGLDAPTKLEALAGLPSQPMSDEEAERQWDRLTPEEQDQFMELLRKMQGRWVEPRPTEATEVSIERLST